MNREKELRSLLKAHDEAYYRDAKPSISDREYDRLKLELESLSKQEDLLGLFDQQSTSEVGVKDSVKPIVGDDRLDEFSSHKHLSPMLSLDNTYDQEEFLEFDQRLCRLLKASALPYVVEPKIDGVAVSLTYENGSLTNATTRGNGIEGDVITQNIVHIENLPLNITNSNFPPLIEIRGEIFMGHEEFDRINQERLNVGLELYANPRNLTAGTVKLLDPKEAKNRKLEIVLYGLGACEPGDHFSSQSQFHKAIKDWRLPTVDFLEFVSSAPEAWDAITKLDQQRDNYTYPTDGAVIKLDSFSLQKEAGSTAKAPRWAIAFKFESERQQTLLEDIQIQVGRTGAITPVAHLKAVQLAGTVVSRASLHNADEIERKDIRIGDTVVVEKAGEIIPQVIEVVQALRSESSEPFIFPRFCPCCESKLEKIDGESAWRCPSQLCSAQIKGRLEYYASRGCMNIDHLGEAVIAQLVDRGFVKKLSDLYMLSNQQLLQLDGFAQKSADNLLETIDKSKNQVLWRFICGLGIKHVGTSASKELAREFGSIQSLEHASEEELTSISGVGSIMAKSIFSFFQNLENQTILRKLEELGLQFNSLQGEPKKKLSLDGKTFVLTGTLENFTREEAGSRIESLGGRVSSSISKKTTFLLAGKGGGSKLSKAQKLDVPILSEDEFSLLIEP